MFKKVKKKLLGKNYQRFRLNRILTKIFGDAYLNKRRKWHYLKKKFSFFKNKLDNPNIGGQKITKTERGFLIDATIDNYLTYHLRPKRSKNFKLESTFKVSDKFAVIIQGPIQENLNFLKNTLQIYKKNFKNSLIIVSTWKDEENNLSKEFYDDNVHFIFNEKIKKSKFNLSQQITTTKAALDFAKTHNVKYCLKTRTDQRIYNNNLDSFFISLLKTFPVKQNKLINSRIVVPAIFTFKFHLYHLTDLIMFGETDDLINYWDNESYEKGLEKIGLNNKDQFVNQTPLNPETFLCSRLIRKIENKVVWDLENWWRCLKDYFCIIDNESLDLLWFKYDWDIEYRNLKTYSDRISSSVSFHEWLSIYNNFENNWNLISRDHEKYQKTDDPFIDNNYKRINNFFE